MGVLILNWLSEEQKLFVLDQDTLWDDHVKFCCEDLNGMEFVEIDVQFRVRDTYGNENFAWATMSDLEDKSSSYSDMSSGYDI